MPEKTGQKEPGKKPAPSKKPKPQQEVVVQIPLSELHPFPDHPFQVREDASMQETAESVKEYGVLVPALARPREDGGYELIAGHRRKHACELAGLATMPVIVRDIDRDAATIIMVDSNLQRENILPSERAKAYKMKMEAIKRQGARTDLTSPKISAKFRSDDEVGQDINTFKYTPKDVSCQLCTEYVKKLGCTALRCPWLAERIEAGVVGYREAVLETFPHERRLFQRLNLLIKHYPGSLWSNEQHERRMQYQCAVQGYRRRRDTNAYYAAMYLLTSNDDIYRRTANCFCKDGIEFGYAVLKSTSPHNYALFMAARDLCDKTEAVTMADLAEPEVIDPEALRLIANATLIARYGLAAFQIRARGAEYDELQLDTLGDRKTALFIIMSDTDDTFNFLISMCYTQLFNLLCEKADDVYGGRLPVHVRCLIDEAANIGQIPRLEKLVATIRSREISCCLVLQAQSQLKALYKDSADTIVGNMDCSIFLGGKEPGTLKELAAALGKETIDSYNTGESRGREVSHSLNYQKLGKELMSVDELAVLDGGKCILQLRGVRPFLSNKYDLTKHPLYRYTADYDRKYAFDIERFLSHRLKLKPDDAVEVYQADLSGEPVA